MIIPIFLKNNKYFYLALIIGTTYFSQLSNCANFLKEG